MAKYLPLPDGSSLKVPDEMGYQEAMTLAQKQFPDLFGETKPKKTGIMGALGQGVESAISSGRTALGALTGSPEEAAKEALARQEALGKKYEEQVSLEKVKQAYEKDGLWSAAKEVAGQIPAAIAEQAPNIATTLGGARAGAALGSLAGPVGTVAGGIAGAALPSLIQQFGGNIQRQAAEQQAAGQPLEIDRGAAAAAAVPQAALDVVGTFVPLGGKLVSKLTGIPEKALLGGAGNAAKLAEERLATTLAKGTAVGAVAEIPTEIAQQMLERAQAGLSLTDTDALAEYGKTAYQVGLLAPIGAAGRVSERSGARLEVEQQRKEEERKAAEAAEAAKNTPEALTQLDDQFRAARQQMTALNEALKIKPAKGDAAAKAEYEQKKTARDTFAKETFKPLAEEYSKRKSAIDTMHAQSMATIEAAAAQGQPSVTQAVVNSNAPVPVARLMDQYGQLGKQLEEVETNLSEAPDVAIQKQLEAQRAELMKRMEGLAPLIEERGGATDTEEAFQKKLADAEQKRKDLLQTGDFEAASKQADVVAGLQAKMPHFEELRKTLTDLGQTRDLFTETPAQPEAKGVEYVNIKGQPVQTVAATKEEAAPAAPVTQTGAERTQQVQAAQIKLAEADTELATAVQSKNPDAINQALFKVNEAGNEVSRTTEKEGQTLKPGIVLDLFDPGNLIRTAIANGDQQTLNNLVRYEDTTKLRNTLEQKRTERERLVQVLDEKLNVAGEKRERADLFPQLYDQDERSKFTNGTNLEVIRRIKTDADGNAVLDKQGKPVEEVIKLQDVYDKGGAAAVEYEYIANQVADLAKKVTTRQGRGQKSYYEQLVDLAAQHEAIKAQLESGMATPTMGEKVAGVQAKLGKGEAPAPRQMDAAERYQLSRRLDAIEKKYRLIEGKVTPVRDEIQKLWNSLYVTEPVAKASTVKAEKAAEAEAAARAPKQMSREAKRAKRINEGDIRYEAMASEKMRNLAQELGEREPEYQKFSNNLTKRLDALKARYGADDKAVAAFRASMGQERLDKALELGQKTPEYKAALKEQIAYFKEVLPTAGKQEAPSKRTTQQTRKATNAPKVLRVAGSRMSEKEQEEIIREAEQPRPARGVETESPDLTPTQVQSLESGDLTAALSDIANDKSNNALNRAVAQRLATLLDATKSVVDDKLTHEGKEVLGWATSKEVHLSRAGGLSQEVLLHEGTHAGAERIIVQFEKDPSKLTPQQRAAVLELKAIHEQVKKDPRITSVNAKSSLSEFVAEVMSNSKLQEQLREKPWRLSDMLRGIKSVILRMIGVKPEEVETMLGASITAIDALFVPSSMQLGITETPTTRSLSAKDIAALHDGSNSMRQFADQFGTMIKQPDRKPEDVERIALGYLKDMVDSPEKFVAQADKDKIDYKSQTIMSDGKPYDENNPLHYVEADVGTYAALKALEEPIQRDREAREINKKRKDDLRKLVELLSRNPSYTLAENALVAKAASKYGVASDKSGTLKIAEIGDNNRHPVAVVSLEAADAIIRELRAGNGLKVAFINGMQKVAEANAKNNERKNGWQKFDQAKDGGYGPVDRREQAAIALNAGAAGTPWCTGAAVSTARSQIEQGDFYIYYKNGKPEVAVRMNGQNTVGEVRGNSPNQALNKDQQKIADDFLSSTNFTNATDFTKQFQNKNRMVEIAKGKESFTLEDLIGSKYAPINSDGTVDDYAVKKYLNFRAIDGYSLRPDPSKEIIEFFGNKLRDVAFEAYEGNAFLFSNITLRGEDGNVFGKRTSKITVDFGGREFTTTPEELLAAQELDFAGYRGKDYVLPKLTFVNKIYVHPRQNYPLNISLPALTGVNEITAFSEGAAASQTVLRLPPDARVDLVRSFGNAALTIEGVKHIGTLDMQGSRGDDGLTVVLPDTLYFKKINDGLQPLVEGVIGKPVSLFSALYREKDFGFSDLRKWRDGELITEKAREMDALHMDVINKFNRAFEPLVSEPLFRQIEEASLTDADRGQMVPDATDYTGNMLVRFFNEMGRTDKNISDAIKALEQAFDTKLEFAKSGVTAPNFVAETPPIQAATETPEVPRYAPKNVGVVEDSKGVFSFKQRRQPSDSVVAREPGIVDKVLGNIMGLAGRVQFVDQYAALDAALKKGMSEGQISALEATNAQYLLRFGQQRSQFSGQFLTNGPVKAEHTKKDGGVETLYRSTKGVSMVDVAQALNKAGLGNDTEQENMFTVYLAGERAKQVGWDKLNFTNPAKAEAEYKSIMAQLSSSKNAKDAFEGAKKLYQQYNAGLLDFLVDTGALSAKKAAELKAITYVPFYRINNNGEVQLMIDKEHPVRISNIKDEPQLKELVGGNTAILPVFTSAAQNTFMITGMGLRNQAVKESAFALHKIGIASRVAPGKGPANSDVVRFKKNGEDHYALIDTNVYGIPAELVVRGMEGIKTTLPAVIKLMGMPANLLRAFVVRNPVYAIRQVVRDPLNAWLTTGTDATPVLSSMKELASMVAGRSEAERKLMETGAISSNVYSGDEQDMAKFLKDLSAGKSGWDIALAKLDAFAMQGDAATRAVVYKDSLAKGMSEQEALLRTLESMNFSRRGVSPSMQALSIMIPFFNAQIQGLDVLYRAYKGDMPFSEQLKIKEKMLARGLMLAAGTMAYAALMSDDEAYKRAKPEERYGNWFVYIPGFSEPVRVPIPFELGYLFKALPEAVYNMAANDEKASKALGGMFKLLEQTNPFSLPQAVKPLTEAVLGKSFFSGDIESAREKNILATERYRDSSTEIAKAIGSVTGKVGISPITIDYLIRGYTGPLGIALVSLANPVLASDTRADVAKPSTKLSKRPFIGGLFQPVEGRGTLDEAYDRMTEIKQAKGAYNKMIEEGRRAEAQAFAQEYSNKLAAVSVSGAAQKQLGELAKQERIIRNHPTMTTEQKDERLERLDKIKVQIARNLLAVSDKTTRQ
jgi:hypothetical protein